MTRNEWISEFETLVGMERSSSVRREMVNEDGVTEVAEAMRLAGGEYMVRYIIDDNTVDFETFKDWRKAWGRFSGYQRHMACKGAPEATRTR